MKYFTGFCMAWGNFCALPCPFKRWDSSLKSIMLGFLPSIGLLIGLLWAVLSTAMVYFNLPFLAVSFIATALPFLLSGFFHADGFMDCSDAILSRRPLEERQRILKDSHTGAFAVISIMFLILGFYSFVSTAISTGIDFINLTIITILSRSVAGLFVLTLKPIGHSQYNELSSGHILKKQGVILLFFQLTVFLGLGFWWSSNCLATGIVCLSVCIACSVSILYAKKQLGGMSGDIAGYGILWGELAGVAALAFC